MELEKGVQRWIVNISEWNPTPNQFSFAMSSLPPHEHSSITRFVKMEDRKRALVSRLLQYALVHEVLGIPFDQIVIHRTLEGKPYLESNKENVEFPNFNFNASHHGDYVAIASEPMCLVGLDVISHFIPGKETVSEFIQNFSPYFSSSEWEKIVNAGTPDDILDEFYRHKTFHSNIVDISKWQAHARLMSVENLDRYWCLKEAFVKALGTGVGDRLDWVEFHHSNWTNIFVKVDGIELKDWKFWLFELKERHSVSVARGHPRMATKNYKKTLKKIHFDETGYNLGLHLRNPTFMLRKVEELIPMPLLAGGVPIGVPTKCESSEVEKTK